MAIMLLSGVLILSRPESLFSHMGDNDDNHHHHSNNTDDHNDNDTDHHHYHYDAKDGGYDMMGLLCAISVPFLSALIVIITR